MPATVREVAREAGVSPSTVSRVVRGDRYVSAESEAAVVAAIAKLGYRPDEAARAIRTGTSRAVGYVVSDITNPVFGSIFKGAEQRLAQDAYSLILAHSGGSAAREATAIEWLRSRRVDGLILSVSDERARHLRAAIAATPTVLLDRSVRGQEADRVRSDHRQGIEQAVRHLVALGHRRVALLGGTRDQLAMRNRAAAFLETPVPDGVDLTVHTVPSGLVSPGVAEDLAQEVLGATPRPTAVLVASTPILTAVLRVTSLRRLVIPRDLSLVACDDLELCQVYNPPIDVVVRDLEALGRAAAETLLARLERPRAPQFDVILPVGFQVRGSSAPPAG